LEQKKGKNETPFTNLLRRNLKKGIQRYSGRQLGKDANKNIYLPKV
jgi:hypothetical protein